MHSEKCSFFHPFPFCRSEADHFVTPLYGYFGYLFPLLHVFSILSIFLSPLHFLDIYLLLVFCNFRVFLCLKIFSVIYSLQMHNICQLKLKSHLSHSDCESHQQRHQTTGTVPTFSTGLPHKGINNATWFLYTDPCTQCVNNLHDSLGEQ